jgi:hypothetical protein
MLAQNILRNSSYKVDSVTLKDYNGYMEISAIMAQPYPYAPRCLKAWSGLDIGEILKYNINKNAENQKRRTKDYEAV